MCGIAGIWNIALEKPLAHVDAMLDAMRHRGPDGRGTLSFRGGSAGMVRLALVDLTRRGQQPLWSVDRRVAIIFNGEMYNFREERSRLVQAGHQFGTATDTEVVLNLYIDRGIEFVRQLRGMYALAIFDWRNVQPGDLPALVLARCPLGIKPLYIAHPQGNLNQVVFSSEIRSLLASGLVPPEVDRQGLADYLSYGFLLQPRTMITGVRMLEPGMVECYTPGRPLRRWKFWSMPGSEPRNESLDDSAVRLREVVEESVKLHSMADAPVGAFLSGGVDSTGVVGLMRKHIPDLRTYTLRFPDLPGQDESELAAATALRFGCRNTIVDVTGEEITGLLPRFAGDIDQPSTDGLNTWLISRTAACEVRAVLSGLGGDEWFAGYPVTRRMARYSATALGRGQALAGRLASYLSGRVSPGWLRQRIDNLSTRKSSLATWIHAHSVFAQEEGRQAAGLPRDERAEEARFAGILDEIEQTWQSESAIGMSMLLDTRVYMLNQLLRDSDAASMAHSLELRVPLVDLQVVRFSRSCRDNYKLQREGGVNSQYSGSGAKQVVIHALRDILPPSIVNRPKRGFSLPMFCWMKGPLSALVEDTCRPEIVAQRGLVAPHVVHRLWAELKFGRHDVVFPQFWCLMVLELWCRAVLDAAPPQVGTTTSVALGSSQ